MLKAVMSQIKKTYCFNKNACILLLRGCNFLAMIYYFDCLGRDFNRNLEIRSSNDFYQISEDLGLVMYNSNTAHHLN